MAPRSRRALLRLSTSAGVGAPGPNAAACNVITEVEIGPGAAYVSEPGHDAWVVGDERFVAFEFESRSAEEYAKG